jgi:hypothetical protein
MSIFQNFIENLQQYPVLIQVIWVIVAILFLSILIFTFFLKIVRTRLRRREKYTFNYQKKIESLLIEYINHKNDDVVEKDVEDSIYSEMKLGMSSKLKRKIILSTILKLKVEVSGEMTEMIEDLFLKIGLLDFSKKKLKNDKWHIVALGIKVLTIFKVESEYNEVMKHVNHERIEVRREAQLYFVKLFEFKGLDFLNEIKASLSEWDQIQLLDVLHKFEDQKIIGVEKWLKSTNNSVVLFALKLCSIYNLLGLKGILLGLLSHENNEVKVQTIKVLSDFQITEAKDILKKTYEEISLEEQITFFKMMETQSVKDDIPFVIKYIEDVNFQIKVSALKILKLLDIEMFRSLKDLKDDLEYIAIVEFVKYN